MRHGDTAREHGVGWYREERLKNVEDAEWVVASIIR